MNEQDERLARARARVGTHIHEKFLLRRLLGVGGSAAVYEARHRNGSRVALKVLHDALDASQHQRKRFLREAYVANTILHPGAVRIHDDGIDAGGAVYLVMELLEGESLAEMQKGARLPLPLVLDVADQVLDVLAAAHARGIVHRDIKPANLFMTSTGQLKVLDFGIARMIEHVAGNTLETQPGTTLGTPAFMPQEQARGRWSEVDARSDLWALGATLFTLASGELVHEGETPNEQYGRAMTVSPRSLASVAPDLPGGLVRIIDRALRYERAERWPDARSMQEALRELAASDVPAPVESGSALVAFSPKTEADTTQLATEGHSIAITAGGGGSPGKHGRLRAIVMIAVLIALALPMALRGLASSRQSGASKAESAPLELTARATQAAPPPSPVPEAPVSIDTVDAPAPARLHGASSPVWHPDTPAVVAPRSRRDVRALAKPSVTAPRSNPLDRRR